MQSIDRQVQHVLDWYVQAVPALRPHGGEEVRVAAGQVECSGTAHTAALQINFVGIDAPVSPDIIDDFQHVHLGQGHVIAIANGSAHYPNRYSLKIRRRQHRSPRKVRASMTMKENLQRILPRRSVVFRDVNAEWLTRTIHARDVGPLLEATEFAQGISVGLDADIPVRCLHGRPQRFF